jgi:type IX secretion system PorP/SprF family membrane protein
MRKNALILLAMVCFSISVVGQDLHFSQVSQIPLLINPAATGVMDGWERVSIHHREQSLGSLGKYRSSMASFDFNMMKPKKNDRAYIGTGIFLYNDVAGDGIMGKQQASLTLSGIIPFWNSGHLISAGLQGGYTNTSLNTTSLRFENQWNGSAFDDMILSGESFNNQYNYMDVGGGFMYQYDGSSKSFFGKHVAKLQLGASVYHLNEPLMKFTSGGEEVLDRKYVIHGAFAKDIHGTDIQIEFDAVHFLQGQQSSSVGGMSVKYCFSKSGIWFGPSSSYIGFGMHLRSFESLIPSFMVLHRGFRLGLSYDSNITRLNDAKGAGAFEISLSYTNFHNAKFTKRRKPKEPKEL